MLLPLRKAPRLRQLKQRRLLQCRWMQLYRKLRQLKQKPMLQCRWMYLYSKQMGRQ